MNPDIEKRRNEVASSQELVHGLLNAQVAELALKRFLIECPVKTKNTTKENWVNRAPYPRLASEVSVLAGQINNVYITNLATSATAYIGPRNDLYHELMKTTTNLSELKLNISASLELPGQLEKGVNQILKDINSSILSLTMVD